MSREDVTRPLGEILGIGHTIPKEMSGVDVDMDRLRSFCRNELGQEDAAEVSCLISEFRDWRDAFVQIVAEESRGLNHDVDE